MLGRMTEASMVRTGILEDRVSTLLAHSPAVLDCLIRHGFTPLRNPAMRAALAPTVTLGQAIRLRGLSPEVREALLADLAEVLACR
jgi:hypothetical protein